AVCEEGAVAAGLFRVPGRRDVPGGIWPGRGRANEPESAVSCRRKLNAFCDLSYAQVTLGFCCEICRIEAGNLAGPKLISRASNAIRRVSVAPHVRSLLGEFNGKNCAVLVAHRGIGPAAMGGSQECPGWPEGSRVNRHPVHE